MAKQKQITRVLSVGDPKQVGRGNAQFVNNGTHW